jgi:hypothetical protein
MIRKHGGTSGSPCHTAWLSQARDAHERGSVIAWSDVNGAKTSILKYDEYGIPAPANPGLFQYTGQMWLTEIGLYNYKARMYSP